MKLRIRALAVAFFVFYFALIPCLQVKAQADFVFSAAFDKQVYTASDPIRVSFSLTNQSQEPAYVNKRFFLNAKNAPEKQREVYLFIIGPEGQELSLRSQRSTGLPRSEAFLILEPKQSAKSDAAQDLRPLYDFIKSGAYKIVATYQNACGRELGLDVISDKIASAPQTITIQE